MSNRVEQRAMTNTNQEALQKAKDQVAIEDGHETGWNMDYEYDMTFTAFRILADRVAIKFAQSERDKAWNEAIEKAIETLFQADSNNILTKLQKLKR
jgi:hypothetical protein